MHWMRCTHTLTILTTQIKVFVRRLVSFSLSLSRAHILFCILYTRDCLSFCECVLCVYSASSSFYCCTIVLSIMILCRTALLPCKRSLSRAPSMHFTFVCVCINFIPKKVGSVSLLFFFAFSFSLPWLDLVCEFIHDAPTRIYFL